MTHNTQLLTGLATIFALSGCTQFECYGEEGRRASVEKSFLSEAFTLHRKKSAGPEHATPMPNLDSARELAKAHCNGTAHFPPNPQRSPATAP